MAAPRNQCGITRVVGEQGAEEGVPVMNDRNSYVHELLGGVENALRQLDPREAEILRFRFGIGERMHDPDEVGMRLGVPRARLRRLESRALRKLRAATLEEWLRTGDDSEVNGHGIH